MHCGHLSNVQKTTHKTYCLVSRNLLLLPVLAGCKKATMTIMPTWSLVTVHIDSHQNKIMLMSNMPAQVNVPGHKSQLTPRDKNQGPNLLTRKRQLQSPKMPNPNLRIFVCGLIQMINLMWPPYIRFVKPWNKVNRSLPNFVLPIMKLPLNSGRLPKHMIWTQQLKLPLWLCMVKLLMMPRLHGFACKVVDREPNYGNTQLFHWGTNCLIWPIAMRKRWIFPQKSMISPACELPFLFVSVRSLGDNAKLSRPMWWQAYCRTMVCKMVS